MRKAFLPGALLILTVSTMAQGTYSEFKISSPDGITGISKSYSQDGNTRTESQISMPKSPTGGINQTILTLKDHPNIFYHINESQKTYTEVAMDNHPGHPDAPRHYEVTVVGKENADGYNATHVIVKAENQLQGTELWLTTDLPNYARYKSGYNQYVNDDIYKAIAAKGIEGMPVKVKAGEHGRNIQMDLVKTETRSNPASLFSIDGYTKSNVVNASQQNAELVKAMKDMTPEERQKMIEEMKKQYGAK